jgi:hypothetical protein
VRAHALNLLTASLTVVLLTAIALPGKHILDGDSASSAQARPLSRTFGVYVDPWHLDEWAAHVGVRPQLVAKFEAFSRKRTLDDFIAESVRRGVREILVTWEPWAPVPTSLGVLKQSLPQPGFRNVDVARGAQDPYIRRFARSLASFHGIVHLRYAHEMNGTWYPWSRDAAAYKRAWRHVVRVVRSAGAMNVRFAWSVNLTLYEPFDVWLRHLNAYWPGARYVDEVGATMINFGGTKNYDVARFAPRLRALRWSYGKPVIIAEANTSFDGRVQWLQDLGRMLASMPWVRTLVWSQLPSRGKAHTPGLGIVDWDVQRDPPAAEALAQVARGFAP